jgi:outer membrane protein assembly factor BamB
MMVWARAGLALLIAATLTKPVVHAIEPWGTYRGNPERAGNTDGKAGPSAAKIRWVLKSKDHHIAAPVPAGARLLVSGLGAFNVASFACLNVAPKTSQRVLWTKSTPYLKLPTVSSPALDQGRLVFGDGMHQTDGANLHCLTLETGLPLWQLPVPGKLVHLEGAPTIAEGKVYIGGGAAGVLCVDLERVSLDGKDMDLASIQKILRRRWQELLAKYEVDKKKDPDFAVPPGEDQLPRAQPRRLWQQGRDKWHVDAPLALAGDRVLAGSAFLDKERLGERALFCLDVKDGAIRWQAPLKLNPWGGPAVSGNLVVVTGSSIGYDTRALKKAKGQVAAFNLADGKEKWRKEVPGGIVACAALSTTPGQGGLAIASATDGKVRAFDLATGERRWIYDAHYPLFAPVAVAAGVAYAGDLKGVVHAIDIATGQARWTLDLGTHKEVMTPGMVYGGPVVHGGCVYVATCNLEGPHAGQATAVVCIGD